MTGRAGSTWSLKPQFGSNLTNVEGGFVTSLGKYQAAWNLTSGSKYSLSWSSPVGTSGSVTLPALPGGKNGKVSLNGKTVHGKTVNKVGGLNLSFAGGSHKVVVQAS